MFDEYFSTSPMLYLPVPLSRYISSTGGPDLVRQLWPVVYVVNSAGAREIPERELHMMAQELVNRRSAAGLEG